MDRHGNRVACLDHIQLAAAAPVSAAIPSSDSESPSSSSEGLHQWIGNAILGRIPNGGWIEMHPHDLAYATTTTWSQRLSGPMAVSPVIG